MDEGSLTDPSEAYTEYPDPLRDEWETAWLPLLVATPVPSLLGHGVSLARRSMPPGLGRRSKGKPKPRLIAALKQIAQIA